MSQIDKDREDDELKDDPLGPEAQAIMDRARRRAAISMVLMLMGFMAIVIVVVYRLAMTPSPDGGYALDAVALPAGAQVIASTLSDGRVTITYRVEDATAIRVFSGSDGTLLREIAIVTDVSP